MVQLLIHIKIPTTNFYVSIRLEKARRRMSGYWKFNSSLLAEDDFQNQFELMIKQELTRAIIGNRWWGNLKDSIRSFSADYSRRLKLDMVAEQRSIKDKLDRAVLAGDSGQVNLAKAELASLIDISPVLHRRMANVELQTKPFVRSFGSISRNFLPGSLSCLFARLKRLGVRVA